MYAAEDAAEEAKEKATKKLNAEEFAKYWGNVGGHNFSSPTGTIKLGSADKAISNLKTCIDNAWNIISVLRLVGMFCNRHGYAHNVNFLESVISD